MSIIYKGISLATGKLPTELEDIKTLSECDAAMSFVKDQIKVVEERIVEQIDEIIEMVKEELEESRLTEARINDLFDTKDAYRWYHTPYRQYSSLAPSIEGMLNPKNTDYRPSYLEGLSVFDGLVLNVTESDAHGWRDDFLALDQGQQRQIIVRAAEIVGHGFVPNVGGVGSKALRTTVWAPGRAGDTSGWDVRPLFEGSEHLDSVIDFFAMLLDLRKSMDLLAFDWSGSRSVLDGDPQRVLRSTVKTPLGSGVLSDEDSGSEVSLPFMYMLLARRYGELVTNSKDIRGSIVKVWNSRREVIGQVVNGRGNQLYIRPIDPFLLALVGALPLGGKEPHIIMGAATEARIQHSIMNLTIHPLEVGERHPVTDLLLSEAMDDRLALNNLVFCAIDNVSYRQSYAMPSWVQPADEAEWVPQFQETYGKNSVINKYSRATSDVAVLLPKAESARAVEKIDKLSALFRDWRDTYLEEHKDVAEWIKKGGRYAEERKAAHDKAMSNWDKDISGVIDMAIKLMDDDPDSEDETMAALRRQHDRADYYRRVFISLVQEQSDDYSHLKEVAMGQAAAVVERSVPSLTEIEKDLLDTKPIGADEWVGEHQILPHLLDHDEDFVKEISEVLGRDVHLIELPTEETE